MKIIKKTLYFVLVAALSAVCFCGCMKEEEHPQTANDITVRYWNSGIGVEYLDKTVENFQKAYPQYRVWLDTSSNRRDIVNDFGMGAEIDTVDLWMFPVDSLSYKTLQEYAEPLNPILEQCYGNERSTITGKYETNVLDALQWPDGNYYTLSYSGGWYGIVYNTDVIDGVKYKLPRTTQELEYLVIDLANDSSLSNMSPFIHYNEVGYWEMIYTAWQAQYDGMEYYTNTFMPLDGGESDPAPSKTILTKQDGRRKALEALDRILAPNYMYRGSNSLVFTDAQTLFINNAAVMMVNGSWMLNEMRNVSGAKDKFLMMKTPVISSIVEQCPSLDGAESGGDPDAELCALIDAVDQAATAAEVPLEGSGYKVTESDRNRVFEARNIMGNNFDAHGFLIPSYSNAKEGAKEFIKYFYSDENLKNYWDTTQLPLPVHYDNGQGPDMTGWDEWSIQQQQLSATSVPLYTIQRTASPVFTAGGANPYADINVVSRFTADSGTDRKSWDLVWDEIVAEHNRKWESYLTNAQLPIE